MATTVYKNKIITLLDDTEIEILPLKIKYLREVMEVFSSSENDKNRDLMELMIKCTRIAMKQYYPKFSKSINHIEDNFTLPQLYDILDVGAGLKFNNSEINIEQVESKPNNVESPSWDTLDLAKLEAEVFLVGIWKDYNDLEMSLSMPELLATLETKRELDYTEKKFLAAIQGVDLDEAQGKGQKEWEDMKARVFSGGATNDSNDVLSLQGVNAQRMGFGIGMGLDYEDARNP